MKKKLGSFVSIASRNRALGCTSTAMNKEAMASDKAADASQAIAKAEEQLKAAKSTGHEWRIIDKLTGSKSESLSKILKAAKEKQEAGELDEAIRAANRVAEAAMLGVEQSKQDATPFYQ